jgi:TPR repeat protein
MRLECRNALQLLGVLAPEPNKTLRENAESGSAEAQLRLAEFLYGAEPRITSNYVQALKWATIAASQGNETAKLLVREIEVLLPPRDVDDGRAAAQEYLERHRKALR